MMKRMNKKMDESRREVDDVECALGGGNEDARAVHTSGRLGGIRRALRSLALVGTYILRYGIRFPRYFDMGFMAFGASSFSDCRFL
jgi:hypothetical protein